MIEPNLHKSLFVASAQTKRRATAEKRFHMLGLTAIFIALSMLAILMTTIVAKGSGAFQQSFITLDVALLEAKLDKKGTRNPDNLKKVTTFGYAPLIKAALEQVVVARGIETDLTSKDMAAIVSKSAAAQMRDRVLNDPRLIGTTTEFKFLANSWIDGYLKGRVTRETIGKNKNISSAQLDFADRLIELGIIEKSFNIQFILGADASDQRPEDAGIGVAIIGSFAMMCVVLLLALPIGVAASIYLEEFAPENRLTDFIEVNVANLAAVPSIVFGILGLAFFINMMHLPQSAPLVGGLVLTLMTLPTIIISTRAALKAVPPSIRSAALGVGASKMQTTIHHVLPLAAPGILTGTILGLAQALGETAPLLLIGMIGYVATNMPETVSQGLLSPNSAMPAQIYERAKRADPAFYGRDGAG